jgi:hypothetical protein
MFLHGHLGGAALRHREAGFHVGLWLPADGDLLGLEAESRTGHRLNGFFTLTLWLFIATFF